MFWLPMMPKKLAKMYVMLRGAYPTFLDHLHYMNRFIVMRRFREAGFVKERDLYGDFLYGKATGASWASSTRRARRYAKFGFLIKLFFDVLPSSLIINRAIFLIAQKPEEKAPSHG